MGSFYTEGMSLTGMMNGNLQSLLSPMVRMVSGTIRVTHPFQRQLAESYEPHITKWSECATPLTTLWFWNTELGMGKRASRVSQARLGVPKLSRLE